MYQTEKTFQYYMTCERFTLSNYYTIVLENNPVLEKVFLFLLFFQFFLEKKGGLSTPNSTGFGEWVIFSGEKEHIGCEIFTCAIYVCVSTRVRIFPFNGNLECRNFVFFLYPYPF